MLTMFAFNSVLILLVTPTTYSYHFRCPVKSQRPLRASAYCTRSLGSEYMCLYDTNKSLFSEQCSKNQDYATRGEKYVLSGSLRNVDCSSNRYQPFTLWSNVSGECLYEKTICEGEGQVIFNNGSLISDRACRCDFTKGYKFIQQPKQNCLCIPSEEDCSCYISTCANGSSLSSDYECVGEEHYYDSKCPALDNKSDSSQYQFIQRNNDEVIQRSFNKSDFYIVVVIGFVVCSLMLLVIVIWGEVWNPYYNKMILILLLYAVLFSSFVIVLIFVEDDLDTVAIGVSLLVGFIVWGTVYVVYLLANHHLLKPPSVYDERYEFWIYKLLKAASKGDMSQLQRINYQKYIDINDTDYNKRSALHLAACEGRYKAVIYLLKNNAGYLERKDRCLGYTPAEDAKWHMKYNANNTPRPCLKEVIDLLHTHKGLKKYKLSFKDDVATKMMIAAENGDVSVLKRLHDSGTDMNLSDPDGRTALHAAVERNQEKVIYYLIDECKVSPFIRWRGQRAEDLLKPQFCKQETANRIREYMANNLSKQETFVHKVQKDKNKDEDLRIVRILNSAYRGDIRLIKAYKDADYDMTVSDYDKRTALHIAVINSQEHIVKYLLKIDRIAQTAGTVKDRWDKTPFEAAMEEGNEIILKMFNCPNIPNTVRNEKKEIRLLIAGEDDDVETLKRLHKYGGSMNFQNSNGTTVWSVAEYEWIDDVIQVLTNKSKSNKNKHKGAILICKKDNILRQKK